MSELFEEQVAVITGAASGLGFAIARRLHSLEARVALLDVDEGQVRSSAERIGERAYPFAVDVTRERDVDACVRRIREQFGRIDVLVNSAGITGRTNLRSHEV
ncbi:MAG TPA: SDR family NAD(P)-dependent oxidoreductase, partial [Blastocatellia bacterium]|nr:SDR family NAD(P)-dependent oxidoreductase [Blastocatellia bacterium]